MQERTKRILIVIGSIFVIALILFATTNSKARQKVAEEIKINLLGMTFNGEKEDDGGFYSDYINGSMDVKYYTLTTISQTVKFNQGGTVKIVEKYSRVYLTEIAGFTTPSDVYNDYNNEYDSFIVEVSISGNITVRFGGSEYIVVVDENNKPRKMINTMNDLILEIGY